MRTLRLVFRFATIGVVCLLLLVLTLLGLPFAWILGRSFAWRALCMRAWAVCLCHVLGMRIRVDGRAPRGAFLLVCNHLSYVDVLLLASRLRAAFVAKSDVRSWPVVGFLAAVGGTLFIDRGRHRDLVRVGEEIRARLDRGLGVILFPEGTSTPGAEVAAFRSSLLEPAARLELPVCYASLRYTTRPGESPANEAIAWWGDMTLGPHLFELLRMPGFEAELSFGDQPIRASDRKLLASELHAAVSERFEPMLAVSAPNPSAPSRVHR